MTFLFGWWTIAYFSFQWYTKKYQLLFVRLHSLCYRELPKFDHSPGGLCLESMDPNLKVVLVYDGRYGEVLYDTFWEHTKYLSRKTENVYLVGGQEDGCFGKTARFQWCKQKGSIRTLTQVQGCKMAVKFLVLLQVDYRGYLHALSVYLCVGMWCQSVQMYTLSILS